MKNDRRDFLKRAGMTGLGLAGAGVMPAYAGTTPALLPNTAPDDKAALVPLNRFPRMVQEYFVGQVGEIEQGAENRRASLRTKSDAEAYVREVRAKIQKCFGPWPQKTPLNARVTGIIDREAYK